MEESLQKMEVELRLLHKKYYFLQETIDNKVDGRVKNLLAELEEAFVDRALEKVLAQLNTTVAVVQSECLEIDEDIGKIQLQSAGEMNGEMNPANVKQEPIDYDETNYEDDLENNFNYNDDDQDEVHAVPVEYGESLLITDYTGSQFVSGVQELEESNECDVDGIDEDGDSNDSMPAPVLDKIDFSSDSYPIDPTPPVLFTENFSVKTSPREKKTFKNLPREKTSVKSSPKEKISNKNKSKIIKNKSKDKIIIKNSPREKASSVKSLSKERTPVLAEDAVVKIGYEGVKRRTWKSSKTEMHKCQDCAMQFSSLLKLTRHNMVTHGNSRPFKCSQCSKSYKSKPHLHRHIKDSHPGTTIAVQSRNTKKGLKELSLESPAKTENKTKSQTKAELKTKSAKSELSFEVTGTKNNYDCSICGKHFVYPSHLKPHLLGHARKLAKQGALAVQ